MPWILGTTAVAAVAAAAVVSSYPTRAEGDDLRMSQSKNEGNRNTRTSTKQSLSSSSISSAHRRARRLLVDQGNARLPSRLPNAINVSAPKPATLLLLQLLLLLLLLLLLPFAVIITPSFRTKHRRFQQYLHVLQNDVGCQRQAGVRRHELHDRLIVVRRVGLLEEVFKRHGYPVPCALLSALAGRFLPGILLLLVW